MRDATCIGAGTNDIVTNPLLAATSINGEKAVITTLSADVRTRAKRPEMAENFIIN